MYFLGKVYEKLDHIYRQNTLFEKYYLVYKMLYIFFRKNIEIVVYKYVLYSFNI